MKSYKNIDEYIANFPPDTQATLQKIRETIRTVLPNATEKIAYGIPTFWQGKNIVHFAAYPTHIGFYPGSEPIKQFAAELKGYNTSKGTIQFPIDQPMPYELIRDITTYCLSKI